LSVVSEGGAEGQLRKRTVVTRGYAT